MKKLGKKIISYGLVACMMVTGNLPVLAHDISISNKTSTDNSELIVTEEGIYVGNTFYSQDEFESLLNEAVEIETPQTYALGALIAGTWWIPGVGEVIITVSGSILVAGAIIEVGSWIYDTVMDWFVNASAKKGAEDAADQIPNKLKEEGKDDVVNLDRFKDKNGRTPNNKNDGTFTSIDDKRYTISKDKSGHTGYDGTKKAWKIEKNGKRFGSLNKDGKVVGD